MLHCLHKQFIYFFSSFHWHYSPTVGFGLSINVHFHSKFHFFLSATNSIYLLTPNTWRSPSTSSFHLFLGLPLLLVPSSSWVKIFWASCPPPFSLGDLTCLSFALLNNLYIYIYIYMCVCVCVYTVYIVGYIDSTERSGAMKDAEYVCHFRFSNRAYYWDFSMYKYSYLTDFREQWPDRYGG